MISCPCIVSGLSLYCQEIFRQLGLNFAWDMCVSADAPGSEICHCAVSADWHLHERSNIMLLFVELHKQPEADTAVAALFSAEST